MGINVYSPQEEAKIGVANAKEDEAGGYNDRISGMHAIT